jgi:hypothetical protein
LNNLVGRGQERFGDGKAERLGGLEVDDEFGLGLLIPETLLATADEVIQ